MTDKKKAPPAQHRLGELLVQRGLVSPRAVSHALDVQKAAQAEKRRTPKLGEILVDTRVLDTRVIREILDDQKIARGEKAVLRIGLEEAAGRVAVLTLHGRLDNDTGPRFVRVLERVMNRGICRIAVDCAKLLYVNSYGISAIIQYVDECRARGGDMTFFGVIPSVQTTLKQIGLGPFLHLAGTRAEALKPPPKNHEPVAELVSTSSGRFFHLSYCADARKFEEDTRLYFIDRSRAERSGKLPCPKCNP